MNNFTITAIEDNLIHALSLLQSRGPFLSDSDELLEELILEAYRIIKGIDKVSIKIKITKGSYEKKRCEGFGCGSDNLPEKLYCAMHEHQVRNKGIV